MCRFCGEINRIGCKDTDRWQWNEDKACFIIPHCEWIPPPMTRVWININPPPGTEIPDFLIKLSQLVSNPNFIKGWVCLEWRNGLEGLHCHIWCRTYKYNSVQTKVRRFCQTNDWFYSKKMTVIKCKFDEEEKKRYCSPQIDDEAKRQKKEQDIVIRNSMGLPHYIPFGDGEPDLLKDLGLALQSSLISFS